MINTLGKRLSKARKAKHLTQEQLTELSGVSSSQLSRLECDKSAPTIDTLLALCDVLDIEFDELLYEYYPQTSASLNPNIKHVVSMMETLDEKHYKFIEELVAVYIASHQKE